MNITIKAAPITIEKVTKMNIVRVPANVFNYKDLVLYTKIGSLNQKYCPLHQAKLIAVYNDSLERNLYLCPESDCGYTFDLNYRHVDSRVRRPRPVVGCYCHCAKPCKDYFCKKLTIDFTINIPQTSILEL
jgi:hypothetical protein